MKKGKLMSVVAVLLCATVTFTSCIGSFRLSNKLLSWNQSIGGKFVNEVVFFVFWILPVYEITMIADLFILNSIEFWSGKSAIAENQTQRVKGQNGDDYVIKNTKNGYKITNKTQKMTVNLNFDEATQTWSAATKNEEVKFMTMLEGDKVMLYLPDGETLEVNLTEQGVAELHSELLMRYSNFAWNN